MGGFRACTIAATRPDGAGEENKKVKKCENIAAGGNMIEFLVRFEEGLCTSTDRVSRGVELLSSVPDGGWIRFDLASIHLWLLP
jgi:hypothetical protein